MSNPSKGIPSNIDLTENGAFRQSGVHPLDTTRYLPNNTPWDNDGKIKDTNVVPNTIRDDMFNAFLINIDTTPLIVNSTLNFDTSMDMDWYWNYGDGTETNSTRLDIHILEDIDDVESLKKYLDIGYDIYIEGDSLYVKDRPSNDNWYHTYNQLSTWTISWSGTTSTNYKITSNNNRRNVTCKKFSKVSLNEDELNERTLICDTDPEICRLRIQKLKYLRQMNEVINNHNKYIKNFNVLSGYASSESYYRQPTDYRLPKERDLELSRANNAYYDLEDVVSSGYFNQGRFIDRGAHLINGPVPEIYDNDDNDRFTTFRNRINTWNMFI